MARGVCSARRYPEPLVHRSGAQPKTEPWGTTRRVDDKTWFRSLGGQGRTPGIRRRGTHVRRHPGREDARRGGRQRSPPRARLVAKRTPVVVPWPQHGSCPPGVVRRQPRRPPRPHPAQCRWSLVTTNTAPTVSAATPARTVAAASRSARARACSGGSRSRVLAAVESFANTTSEMPRRSLI